jgi:iron complex outermembrane receptor protein
MRLTDEIHFDPINFVNTNLDPTRRRGVETIASWQATRDVRLRGNLTYTDAEFRSGPFAGNEVPMVSPWTGNAGVSWNIFGPQLWLDANLRFFSRRFLDGDEINANAVYFVPSTTLVDLKVGGQVDHLFWSATVQNLFDRKYYDYGLDQGFGFFSFYPQPGRTYMMKAGTTW